MVEENKASRKLTQVARTCQKRKIFLIPTNNPFLFARCIVPRNHCFALRPYSAVRINSPFLVTRATIEKGYRLYMRPNSLNGPGDSHVVFSSRVPTAARRNSRYCETSSSLANLSALNCSELLWAPTATREPSLTLLWRTPLGAYGDPKEVPARHTAGLTPLRDKAGRDAVYSRTRQGGTPSTPAQGRERRRPLPHQRASATP